MECKEEYYKKLSKDYKKALKNCLHIGEVMLLHRIHSNIIKDNYYQKIIL